LTFEFSEVQWTFKAKWQKEHVEGIVPPARTSHTSTAYNNNYMIIIGGEGYGQSILSNKFLCLKSFFLT